MERKLPLDFKADFFGAAALSFVEFVRKQMGQNQIADRFRPCPLLWAASGSAGAQMWEG